MTLHICSLIHLSLINVFPLPEEQAILVILHESKHLITCRKGKYSFTYFWFMKMNCSLSRSTSLIDHFPSFKCYGILCNQEWSIFCLSSIESGATVSKNYDLSDLPGSPSKPQVTDVTKNSVTLSWQPGTPGALPASAYIIEAFRYGTIPFFFFFPPLGCCLSFYILKSHVSYPAVLS